ncbi:MAG: hypothetical protein RL030_1473 [Pseudomonadota bacterium]|jgi:hypothetical protein
MAKVNFRQQKRAKELARKERQTQRLSRRGERPPEEAAAALVNADPIADPKPAGETT